MKLLAIRNGLWNAGATIVGIVTGMVGTLFIPRILTTEEYGLFSYYIWLAGIFGILGTLALPGALTKIASELRGQQQSGEAKSLSIGIILLLMTINVILSTGVIFWAFQSPPIERIFLLIVGTVLIPQAMASILRSILMALEQYRPISLTLMAASLLQLALIGLAAFKGWGAPGFVAAMLSGNVFQFIALLLALRMPARKINVSSQRLSLQVPQRSTIQHYLAFLLPSTICLVTNQIVWERSEVFFLRQANSGLEEIGFYSLAYTIFSMFFVLGGAFLNPFRPSISYDYGAGNWGSIQEKMQQGVLIATLYGVPLSLGGWITLDSLIPLLVTQKMQPAADVARVLFMGMIPATIGVMLGLMLGAANGIWTSARLGIIMSVVNISLDMFLIPRFHALGGAIANTSSQIVYVLLLFVAVRQLYAIVLPWRTMGMVFLIGLLTTFVVPWGVQVWLPGIFGLFLAIGLGGGLYLATLWFLGYLKIFFESRHTQSPGMVSESVT